MASIMSLDELHQYSLRGIFARQRYWRFYIDHKYHHYHRGPRNRSVFREESQFFLVYQGMLDSLTYIEHGTHWAILDLGIAMLLGLFLHVSEPVTALVGFVFLSLACMSSTRVKAAA